MRWARSLTVVLVLVSALMPAADLGAQECRPVIIASGRVVGVYYPLTGAMSRIAYHTRDLNIRAAVEAPGASVANARLIGAGDADFALRQNDIAYFAYHGSAL